MHCNMLTNSIFTLIRTICSLQPHATLPAVWYASVLMHMNTVILWLIAFLMVDRSLAGRMATSCYLIWLPRSASGTCQTFSVRNTCASCSAPMATLADLQRTRTLSDANVNVLTSGSGRQVDGLRASPDQHCSNGGHDMRCWWNDAVVACRHRTGMWSVGRLSILYTFVNLHAHPNWFINFCSGNSRRVTTRFGFWGRIALAKKGRAFHSGGTIQTLIKHIIRLLFMSALMISKAA
jgi:hypothetical protein